MHTIDDYSFSNASKSSKNNIINIDTRSIRSCSSPSNSEKEPEPECFQDVSWFEPNFSSIEL